MKTTNRIVLTTAKNSQAYNFMLSIRKFIGNPLEEVTFFSKKSGNDMDAWEVFASGIRDMEEIAYGHPRIGYKIS